MNRTILLLALFLMSCQDDGGAVQVALFRDARVDPYRWAPVDDLGDHAVGLVSDGTTMGARRRPRARDHRRRDMAVATHDRLARRSLAVLGTAAGTLLVEADGIGLMRWNGTEWVLPTTSPPPGLISSFNPRRNPCRTVPQARLLVARRRRWSVPHIRHRRYHPSRSRPTQAQPVFHRHPGIRHTILTAAMLPAGLLPDEFDFSRASCLSPTTAVPRGWMPLRMHRSATRQACSTRRNRSRVGPRTAVCTPV